MSRMVDGRVAGLQGFFALELQRRQTAGRRAWCAVIEVNACEAVSETYAAKSPRAMREPAAGSRKLSVPTATSRAPTSRNWRA
jgi:hypothetical protein